jgi:hypothetical protein
MSSTDLTDLSNLNDIGSSLSDITSIVNQYVVSPLAAFGVAGFVFNAVGEATANISADITDHYTEDNKAIQDQIAIRPKRITLKGYVGELVYANPGTSPSVINTLAQKLTSLSSFLPAITASATQVQEAVANPAGENFPTVLGTASNIYGLIQNTLGAFGQTQNQQNAYTYFKALLQSATLMGVQTPWEFMTNMAVESIVAIQPENSQWITDFSITLKEIRIAQTSSVPQSNASAAAGAPGIAGTQNTPAVLSGPAGVQQQPITNLGPIPGANATSLLTGVLSGSVF